MIDTLAIFEKLKDRMDPAAAQGIAEVLGEMFAQLQETTAQRWQQQVEEPVTALRAEVHERLTRLEGVVEQLVLVQQQHTEQIAELREAVAELRQSVVELREATRRNTEAIAELRQSVAELQEATRRNTEAIAELRQTVERLVQVSEQHSREIAESRKRLDELWERTQREIRELVRSIADLRRQFGGLSMTVGYSLEDQAYKALPQLLLRDYGIQVQGRLKRQFVQDAQGAYLEVNIFGQAQRDGETVTIVGEGKVQLSKNDVNDFLRRKVQRLQQVYPNIFPVLVTRMISEWNVEEYARKRGVALYYSYDF